MSGANPLKGPGGFFSVTVLLGVAVSLGVQRCLKLTPCLLQCVHSLLQLFTIFVRGPCSPYGSPNFL